MSADAQKKRSRWVVKAGSQLVFNGGPLLLRAWMQQVMRLKKDANIEIIWVTSGAIASATETTSLAPSERTLSDQQALSAIGQPLLMDNYLLSLGAFGLKGAQILLTEGDLLDSSRLINFQNTVNKLLDWGVVPILNENDAVATEEIKFGDNDRLSAIVAHSMKADKLVILTNVEGLYDKDPSRINESTRIEHLNEITDTLLDTVKPESKSEMGRGGMYSKLIAAKEATSNGIETWLVKGDQANILTSVANNLPVGTKIEKKQ